MIDGIFDDKGIANKFANVFESVSVPSSVDRHKLLETEFFTRFSQYVGDGCSNIKADLVANCIDNLKKSKASGLDGLMAEHLSFAHLTLVVHLSLLFTILLKHSVVPDAFGRSEIIPLLKNADGNHFTSDNYRAITLSPVINKLLEMVILALVDAHLQSDSLQYGFKPKSSCSHALLTLKTAINHYVKGN